jgi:hypothetical protein
VRPFDASNVMGGGAGCNYFKKVYGWGGERHSHSSRGDNYHGPGCVGVTGLLKMMKFLTGVKDGSVTFVIDLLTLSWRKDSFHDQFPAEPDTMIEIDLEDADGGTTM